MIDKISKPFDTESGSSIASWDTLLIDNSPSCDPNTVVWHPKNRIPTQSLETCVARHLLAIIGQEGNESFLRPWSEKKNPFTQANLLDNEEDQTQDLIYRIRSSISIPYRERLANRLLTLFSDAKEEEPASFGIAVDSLRNFYNFLHLHTNLKYPSISLTPDDSIYASWRDEQNKVFSVLFLPNGEDARFVMFKPNNRHPKRQIRISGTATTDILIETVEPYDVLDWISE